MGVFGNTLSAGNQDSPIGAIGGKIQKWTDPTQSLQQNLARDQQRRQALASALNQGNIYG